MRLKTDYPTTEKDAVNLGAMVAYSKSKTLVFTRALNATSGDVAYTGIGFKPTALMINATLDNSNNKDFSIGFGDSGLAVNNTAQEWNSLWATNPGGAAIVYIDTDGSNKQVAILKSLDTDGFTLTWTKMGNQAGTISLLTMSWR